MKRKLLPILLIVISFCLASWGNDGHQVVGYIADIHLDAVTRDSVKSILHGKDLKDISTSAGNSFIGSRSAIEAMSVLNIPPNEDDDSFFKELKGNPGNICDVLEKQLQMLKTHRGSQKEKIMALKRVVALVADIHQPFYFSGTKSQRTDGIENMADGANRSLQDNWEDKLIDAQSNDDRALAIKIDLETDKIKKQRLILLPAIWLNESYKIGVALQEAAQKHRVNEIYQEETSKLLNERLELAGLRLAAVLRNVFYTGPANTKI